MLQSFTESLKKKKKGKWSEMNSFFQGWTSVPLPPAQGSSPQCAWWWRSVVAAARWCLLASGVSVTPYRPASSPHELRALLHLSPCCLHHRRGLFWCVRSLCSGCATWWPWRCACAAAPSCPHQTLWWRDTTQRRDGNLHETCKDKKKKVVFWHHIISYGEQGTHLWLRQQ